MALATQGEARNPAASAAAASASPAPAIALDFKWLAALGVLWFVLVALASLSDSRDLAVALAWLIATGALLYSVPLAVGRGAALKGAGQ